MDENDRKYARLTTDAHDAAVPTLDALEEEFARAVAFVDGMVVSMEAEGGNEHSIAHAFAAASALRSARANAKVALLLHEGAHRSGDHEPPAEPGSAKRKRKGRHDDGEAE